MKKLNHIFFSLFTLMTFLLPAQDKTNGELVEIYLESSGSFGQYGFAYHQLLQMLNKQYRKSETNVQEWKYLQENKEKAVADMKSLLVPVYQQNFSQGDITKMTDFYQTKAGKQLIKDRTKMTQAQKQELNSYYSTEVGQKIIEKQSLLSKAILAASENWSRELYETAVSLLKSE